MQTSRAGYSNRHTPTIELLRPKTQRPTKKAPRPLSEIEDAVFETVVPKVELADCAYGAPEGLFVPHVDSEGHVSPGYCETSPGPAANSGRLDLFSGKTLPDGAMRASHSPIAGPAFLTGVVAVAAAFFWMAGGHSFVAGPDETLMTATVPATVFAGKAMSVESVSPFKDAAVVPAEMARPVGNHKTPDPQLSGAVDKRPTVLPARIERAGSILMIRSGN